MKNVNFKEARLLFKGPEAKPASPDTVYLRQGLQEGNKDTVEAGQLAKQAAGKAWEAAKAYGSGAVKQASLSARRFYGHREQDYNIAKASVLDKSVKGLQAVNLKERQIAYGAVRSVTNVASAAADAAGAVNDLQVKVADAYNGAAQTCEDTLNSGKRGWKAAGILYARLKSGANQAIATAKKETSSAWEEAGSTQGQ